MVLWENVFFNIPDHVVSVDFPEIAYRSVAEPGVEIFIADQFDQFITGDGDGDFPRPSRERDRPSAARSG